MATTRFDLEKFNGDNDFYLWSLKMRAILIQQGLDSALDDGDEDLKGKKDHIEGSSKSGGDQKTINNKAHNTIILHLSDEVLREVAKERIALGLWSKLEDLYLKKSLAKRLYMKRRLYTFSMKEGVAIKDHLDEFNKLILDIENVNIDLEEEDRALIMLSSLPDSFEHFVDTLLYGRQTLTLKDSKPEKKNNKEEKNANQKDKSEKKKKKMKCYFCQKEGHYIKDCFEKKKLEKLQKESNGKAAIVSEDEGDSEGVDVLVVTEKHPTATVSNDKTKLWHTRLAHISERGLKELKKQDLWGPSQVPSHSGARYFITFIDDYSRKVWVYVLRQKSEALEKFKEWSTLVENQTGKKIKRLRTDNGLEYCSNEFDEFCKNKGIIRHKIVRHTPQQNGLAEKMNRTLLEKVRCMLFNANLSKHFWVEAVTTIVYLVNRSPSSTLNFRTPQEAWSGYPEGTKRYKIWCIDGKPSRTLISRDVVFDGDSILLSKVETEVMSSGLDGKQDVELKVEYTDGYQLAKKTPGKSEKESKSFELDNYQLVRDRERRTIRMPEKNGIVNLISYALRVGEELSGEEPMSYKEAMCRSDKAKWLAVMEEELASLRKNNTWILVEKPLNKRLVAKGFTQKDGVDFNEVFSPVVKHNSIRLLLVVTAFLDLELDQMDVRRMDVRTAFLHGNIDEEIFMAQPEGFIEEGAEDIVCLLKKSLYGLKQSPREALEELKMQLNTEFKMKDLGAATKILAHFKLSNLQQPTTDADIEYMKKIPYSNAVGSVMYAMVCSRLDIAYGVGVVNKFMGDPGKEHWNGVKWILRYLKGTSDHGILFGKVDGATCEVAGFVNSDFAGDLDKRRSITSFVFTMCGGAISWKASLQSVVALSTTEAEYIALTEAVNEAVWLRGLVSKLGFKQETITINCDSSSAIQLSKNLKYHERTKHIDVRLHFIREEISSGIVNVVKIPSEVNPADILTKPLPAVKFMNSLNLIGLGNM
ncbi:hypothetical protein KPL70_026312 [Citrus sinensis]|nr:hypothetical protein KPL70_026312 [Citrus sinensis]